MKTFYFILLFFFLNQQITNLSFYLTHFSYPKFLVTSNSDEFDDDEGSEEEQENEEIEENA